MSVETRTIAVIFTDCSEARFELSLANPNVNSMIVKHVSIFNFDTSDGSYLLLARSSLTNSTIFHFSGRLDGYVCPNTQYNLTGPVNGIHTISLVESDGFPPTLNIALAITFEFKKI